jgi:eukaryotic-like serine/threonine-protein kinase
MGSDPQLMVRDRWRCEAKLATLPTHSVWRAWDELLHRPVAVRIFHPEALDQPDARERLQRTFSVAASLQHDNIACVYDAFEDRLGLVLIGELVEGPTLREVSAHLARLPDAGVAAIGAQLASGAAAAAMVGLTHREMSPSQVRITYDGTVKILGFGSARLLADTATPLAGLDADPTYLAPEQVGGGNSDHRSDIYTIGLMLWELSAGALPFGGDLDQRMLADIPALRTARPSVSSHLSATIERATRRNVDARWDDAQQLATSLLEECPGRPKFVVADVAAWLLPDAPAPIATLRSADAVAADDGGVTDEPGDEVGSVVRTPRGQPAAPQRGPGR